MKITLQYRIEGAPGSGTPYQDLAFVLGDDSDRKPVSDFKTGAKIETQVENIPRGESPVLFNRKNRAWNLSWNTKHSADSMELLYEWMVQHIEDVTHSGTLTVQMASKTKTFEVIVYDVQPVRFNGQSCILQYSAIGVSA